MAQSSIVGKSRLPSVIKFLDLILEMGFPLTIVFAAYKALSSIPAPPPGFNF